MRHDRDRYPDHSLVPDTFWFVVAAVLFAACGLVWLIGQVAAIVFGAREHLPVRLVDMLGVLLRLPGTWDDPAQAWPPSSQLLPGPVGMYAAAIDPDRERRNGRIRTAAVRRLIAAYRTEYRALLREERARLGGGANAA